MIVKLKALIFEFQFLCCIVNEGLEMGAFSQLYAH